MVPCRCFMIAGWFLGQISKDSNFRLIMMRFYLLICLETENCCEIIIYGSLLPCGELLSPFPFLFFFYSKTIYLATPKNVLLSVLFLLLDPIYSFYKNFPLFKTFPLSPKFLFQTLFFSKISSSLTFSNEWQNSNLLDLSWTISITYTPAGIKICLLLSRIFKIQ